MTTLEITEGIKNSLLSDLTIDTCLKLHENNHGLFIHFISKLESDIDNLLKYNYSIYDAFSLCRDIRTLRMSNDDSIEQFEKVLIRMVGELSKYRKEIIFGEMASNLKIFEIEKGNIKRKRKYGYK